MEADHMFSFVTLSGIFHYFSNVQYLQIEIEEKNISCLSSGIVQ